MCESEKQDKRRVNRALRKRVKMAIIHGVDILPTMREVFNQWSMGKDGKKWYGWDNPYIKRLLRK